MVTKRLGFAASLAFASLAFAQSAVVAGGSAGFFKAPFASVGYGRATFEHEGVGASFANAGVVEIAVGSAEFWGGPPFAISGYASSALAYAYRSPSLGGDGAGAGVEGWTLAYRSSDALGYRVGGGSIFLDHAWSLGVEDLLPDRDGALDADDRARFDRLYGVGMAQGHVAAVKVAAFPRLTLELSYGRDLVYPRVVVPQWASSVVVERAPILLFRALASYFVFLTELSASDSHFAPALAFLARAGWTSFVFAKRESDMHWPHPSEAPLFSDRFSVGATFHF